MSMSVYTSWEIESISWFIREHEFDKKKKKDVHKFENEKKKNLGVCIQKDLSLPDFSEAHSSFLLEASSLRLH